MRSTLLAFVLGAIFVLDAVKVHADLEVSAGVRVHAVAQFHAPLAAHGTWIEVGSYGRCWRPAGVTVVWRPYCEGHWIWTDCGWYWASDEPWAWACYHYGWWTLDSVHGWIWVPGIEWAPAWVTWRVGGGYCGWAPLPPRGVVRPAVFVFVEERRFHEPVHSKTVIVNNTTIINKTKVISNERRETRNIAGIRQTVIINEGPSLAGIQKASGRELTQTPVQEAVRQTPKPQAILRTEPKSESIPRRAPAAKPNAPDVKQDSAPGRATPTPVEKQTLPPQLKDLPKQKELPPKNEHVAPGRPRSQTVPPAKSANVHGVEKGQEKQDK